MNASEIFIRMAHNNVWANYRLHRAVDKLTAEEYRATRTGFFPSLHLTLSHIMFVDLMYVDALEGGTKGVALFADNDAFDRDGTFAQLREMQRAIDQRLIVVAGRRLDDDIHIHRADRVQVDKRADVLLHLFQHQTHHRGQAHAMLSGTSVAPPQLDEFFMGSELPLREGELRELGLPLR